MNSKKAENETAIDRLRAYMAQRDKDTAKRNVGVGIRENWAIMLFVVGAVAWFFIMVVLMLNAAGILK